jgi:hypothetical protein
MAAPKENTNAEKWTLKEATKFMELALKTAQKKDFDFIGEVANELDTYREVFVYLSDKYKPCKTLYKRLQQKCEANCFSHGKTGDIVPSLAIMNLKSNHGWTDRVDTTTKGESVKSVTRRIIKPDESTD